MNKKLKKKTKEDKLTKKQIEEVCNTVLNDNITPKHIIFLTKKAYKDFKKACNKIKK